MDFDEEDYTGCTITCTSWVQDDAFFTAVLVDKVAKGGWGQIYLAQVKDGPAEGSYVAVKVRPGTGGFAHHAPVCAKDWLTVNLLARTLAGRSSQLAARSRCQR